MKVLLLIALLIPALMFSSNIEKKETPETKKSVKNEDMRWRGERISVDLKTSIFAIFSCSLPTSAE
jgi:hypothetical protein